MLQEFVEYVRHMDIFFIATAALGVHTVDHIDYGMCRRAKAMLVLIGRKKIDNLVKHVGKII